MKTASLRNVRPLAPCTLKLTAPVFSRLTACFVRRLERKLRLLVGLAGQEPPKAGVGPSPRSLLHERFVATLTDLSVELTRERSTASCGQRHCHRAENAALSESWLKKATGHDVGGTQSRPSRTV